MNRPPLIQGSATYSSLESNIIKASITFTTNISISNLSANIITDNYLTISNGSISGISPVTSDGTSAINKDFVDSYGVFNPSGPQNSIQYTTTSEFNQTIFTGTSNFTYENDVVNVPGTIFHETITKDLRIMNTNTSSTIITNNSVEDYDIVLPLVGPFIEVTTHFPPTNYAATFAWSPTLNLYITADGYDFIYKSTDGINYTTVSTLPCGYVVWNSLFNRFIGSSYNYKILQSTNGITWTTIFSYNASSRPVLSISNDNTQLLAAGSNVLYKTPDLINWTSQSLDYYVQSIIYVDQLGIYCANGNYYGYSYDTINWITTYVNGSFATYPDYHQPFIWSPELQILCYVYPGFSFSTSKDGINWEIQMLPTMFSDVAYSPLDHTFVATIPSETYIGFLVSRDGYGWEIVKSRPNEVYCDLLNFIVYNSNNNTFHTIFYDAIAETSLTPIKSILHNSLFGTEYILTTGAYQAGCWSPELDKLIFIGNGGEYLLGHEDANGDMIWEYFNIPTQKYISTYVVYWAPFLNLFCGVATIEDDTSLDTCAITSSDGINWTITIIVPPGFIFFYPIVAVGNSVVIIASGGTLFKTTDGINYTNVFNFGGFFLTVVCWNSTLNLFLALAQDKIATSSDGINWTTITIPNTFYTPRGLTYSSTFDMYVLVNDPYLYSSINFIDWTLNTQITNCISVNWSSSLELFCVCAYQPTVAYTSPDFINWDIKTQQIIIDPYIGVLFSNNHNFYYGTIYKNSIYKIKDTKVLEWRLEDPLAPEYSIQFNDNNSLTGSSNLLYNGGLTTNIITCTNVVSDQVLSTSIKLFSDDKFINLYSRETPIDITFNLPKNAVPTSRSVVLGTSNSSIAFVTSFMGTVPAYPINAVQYSTASNGGLLGSNNLIYTPNDYSAGLGVNLGINQTNYINFTTISTTSLTTLTNVIYNQGLLYCHNDTSVYLVDYPNVVFTTSGFSNLRSMSISNNVVYLLSNNTLNILESTMETLPNTHLVNVSSLGVGTDCRDIVTFGNYAFITDHSNNPIIVDISDVLRPTTLSVITGLSNSNSIFMFNNNCFVGTDTSIYEISVADILNPTTSLVISVPSSQLYVDPTYIYSIHSGSNSFNILTHDGNSLVSVSSLSIPSPTKFEVSGNNCYVTSDASLLNVSMFISPSTKSTITFTTQIRALDLVGNKTFVSSNNGLYVCDPQGVSMNGITTQSIQVQNTIVTDNVLTDNLVVNNLNAEFMVTDSLSLVKDLVVIQTFSEIVTFSSNACLVNIQNPSIISPTSSAILTINNDVLNTNTILNLSVNGYTNGYPHLSISNVVDGAAEILVTNVSNGNMYGGMFIGIVIY